MPKYKAKVELVVESDSLEHADSDLHDLLEHGAIVDWKYAEEGLLEKIHEPDLWVFFRGDTVVYVSVGAPLDENARQFIMNDVGADRCEPCPSWDLGDTEEDILEKVNKKTLQQDSPMVRTLLILE